MLKVKEVTLKTQPVKIIENIRGVDIPLFIRPWNGEIAETIKKRHTKGFEWVPNAQGKKERQDVINNDAYFDDMVDYVIASFEGVGNEAGEPWPNDIEHKKKLLSLSVEKGADPLFDRILEKAKALAFEIEEEEAANLKN